MEIILDSSVQVLMAMHWKSALVRYLISMQMVIVLSIQCLRSLFRKPIFYPKCLMYNTYAKTYLGLCIHYSLYLPICNPLILNLTFLSSFTASFWNETCWVFSWRLWTKNAEATFVCSCYRPLISSSKTSATRPPSVSKY